MSKKKIPYIVGGVILLIIVIIVIVSTDGQKKEAEIAQPEQISSETSEQIETIDTFVEKHKNIPLPAGAILKEYSPYQPETSTTAQQDESFSYEVNLPQEEVIRFYKENLSRFGWETNYTEKNIMFFKNKEELLFVGVDEKFQNESTLTIMVGK